jgi:glutamate synthase (NADPH/NADH) large chain
MGDDTPFAVLSSQPRIIYDYFRQQFAQVTNPIDPLREAHVMSLATSIGREMNVFCEAEGQAHRLSFKSPILLYSDFKQLTTMKRALSRRCAGHHLRCDRNLAGRDGESAVRQSRTDGA